MTVTCFLLDKGCNVHNIDSVFMCLLLSNSLNNLSLRLKTKHVICYLTLHKTNMPRTF